MTISTSPPASQPLSEMLGSETVGSMKLDKMVCFLKGSLGLVFKPEASRC